MTEEEAKITFWQTLLLIIIAYVSCVVVHLVKLILFRDRRDESLWPANRRKPVKTLIVMGSGGHTGEMVRLLSALDFRHFAPRLYLVARTDDMSAKRVQQLESSHVSTADSFQTVAISRSREVHQSWISTVLSFLISILDSLRILFSYQPDLILCNGPGTCVPPCVIALLLRALFIKRSTIVFVESICRVTTLSLTGKLMLFILADRSIVQWPELHAKYPQTVFLGRLV
ncbi:UDP-N-acetylglucosamine transferase subunit ALG14 homolog [Daphnia pulex]|uniref:UDP-N-acetylglucosamine transferase subunit ALG14 homolog n=1 Tax=Daphnia pulex TaxID=6669 RepID=UPI001EE0F5E7|nr:UDP-N-acetylglucosamine transferase subunit ALG14 homolog [Daphnia pulex]XP_046455660.1 UDP-N-acetylglucosamine transferase subunit ALG14 homolog [Daphnia pulex]